MHKASVEALTASPILVDQVYRSLLGAITDRTLQPGQRILQAELASSLGVSRQPVSHALQLLKHQGLVQDAGRQGLEVVPIDARRIRQLYEVRGSLDGLAARLAAGRVARGEAPGAQGHLDEALAGVTRLSARPTLTRLVQADVDFHQTIYSLSGNPAITEMIAAQWPHLRRSMGTVLEIESHRQLAWSEHAEIARFILAGDPEAAGAAASQHAERAGTDTEARLNPSSGCGAGPTGA